METMNIFSESGIIITLIFIFIPVVFASIIAIIKAYAAIDGYLKTKSLEKFREYLKGLSAEEIAKLGCILHSCKI